MFIISLIVLGLFACRAQNCMRMRNNNNNKTHNKSTDFFYSFCDYLHTYWLVWMIEFLFCIAHLISFTFPILTFHAQHLWSRKKNVCNMSKIVFCAFAILRSSYFEYIYCLYHTVHHSNVPINKSNFTSTILFNGHCNDKQIVYIFLPQQE